MRLLKAIGEWSIRNLRGMFIPSPPFRACKRTASIMYGVWYGRMTPDESRQKAAAWDFTPHDINEMLEEATRSPSYWSRYPVA